MSEMRKSDHLRRKYKKVVVGAEAGPDEDLKGVKCS